MILLSKHFPAAALKDLLGAAALAALEAELPQVTEDLIARTVLLPQSDGSMTVQFTLHPEAEKMRAANAAVSANSRKVSPPSESSKKAAGQ